MSIDRYLGAIYDEDSYNCLHFVRDVWRDIDGHDIGRWLADVLQGPVSRRRARKAMWAGFKRLQGPCDPSLVLMLAPYQRPHAGVLVRGRCLHLTELGATHVPLQIASLGFKSVRFYQCR